MMGRLRGVLLSALYFFPALVLRALDWRLLKLTNVHRIGHLAAEPDAVLKEEALGHFPPHKTLLLAPRGGVANEHLVTYWSRHFRTVRSPALCALLGPLNRFSFVRVREDVERYVVAINGTAAYVRVQREWADRAPLLGLTPEDVQRGERRMRDLGIPEAARFVCFHSREGGYSPDDEHLHDFRNTSIENYLAAARTLFERGVHSVRMGDRSMRPIPETPGVIDYAHSPLRADWMDIFLCAHCEFFLGNSSGIAFLSMSFGRPTAAANLIPVSGAYPYGPADLGIPKLLRKHGRLLAFAELLASDIANFRFAELYARHDLEPVENTADEVRDLALEMLERVEGRVRYSPEDERRQARFRALFRPGHFSHGSAGRVGRDFLRKYEYLFGDHPQA
jgi:putative glycosyltransferase (TIGR04372 family)